MSPPPPSASAIVADWQAGHPIPDICQRYRVGRATVYWLIGQRESASVGKTATR